MIKLPAPQTETVYRYDFKTDGPVVIDEIDGYAFRVTGVVVSDDGSDDVMVQVSGRKQLKGGGDDPRATREQNVYNRRIESEVVTAWRQRQEA